MQRFILKHLQLSAKKYLFSRSVSTIFFADEDSHILNAGGRILLKNQHGEIITAKYVVITVPLTILKDRDITFVPELPADKNRAINRIQMLGVWKIICQFKRRFWPDFIKFTVDGDLQVKYGCGRVTRLLMTTSVTWLLDLKPAQSAEQKSSLSSQQILDGLLSHLDEMFG